jgi:hypothetical protein
VFTQHVPAGQEELYRLPIALKDFALPTPGPFSGILYPSIAMYALMDNVAQLIPEVDTKLKLFEVIFLTVESSFETPTEDGGKKTEVNLRCWDFARPDSSGNLIWGQVSQVMSLDGTSAVNLPPPRVLPPVLPTSA